ncbi:MAG: L-arabinose isomerase [Clostridiaceae bacterium]|nr:L-arabinose isomerase [Clostridiaceae bacterium]
MKKVYFLVGSQNLYGPEALEVVRKQSQEMVDNLQNELKDVINIELLPTVIDSETCVEDMKIVNNDDDCIGIICWMHTFSPAKMWIKGLQILNKPMLHLHTQYNRELPYSTIDMDFMNLNQAAHGDREFGFIVSRLGIPREVAAGYYLNSNVLDKIRRFIRVAKAIQYSKNLKVAMFGNNMRDVSVTDGDRVESQIRFGWEVNYYGIGDLVELINNVTDAEVATKMSEYKEKYEFNTDDLDSVEVQAKYEVALDKFVAANGVGAFTDTFEDLHGMEQLPGLAVQNLMDKEIGFGPEGDYKTAALGPVLQMMARDKDGATGFIEDYTYDLTEGEELELASHMLEVPPAFAAEKPKIEVHPLGIGGKADPARLVFDGVSGKGIQVCMTDMGDRFRIVCAEIELVDIPKEMPNLPVARILYRHEPNFEIGTTAWLMAGGGHHSIVSTALDAADIKLFAHLTNTECIVIDKHTTEKDYYSY